MKKSIELRVQKHANDLTAIFPNAKKQGLELCRGLRSIERQGAAFGLRLCNGPAFQSEERQDAEHAKILEKANVLLGNEFGAVPVFLNQDPRGYALKIEDGYVRKFQLEIHRDWGGYGIIAPDLTD